MTNKLKTNKSEAATTSPRLYCICARSAERESEATRDESWRCRAMFQAALLPNLK